MTNYKEAYCPGCEVSKVLSKSHLESNKWFCSDCDDWGRGSRGTNSKNKLCGYYTTAELEAAFLAANKGPAPALKGDNDAGITLYESPRIIQNSFLTLPTDSQVRKDFPMFRGCLKYFAAALAGVARTSKLGNDKHNPGEELHHARGKSMDHADCIVRHLMDCADMLADLERKKGDSTVKPQQILDEASSLAWRALAYSQELHERFGAPMAPGAKK